MSGAFDKVQEWVGKIGDALGNIGGGIKGIVESIGGKVKSIGSSIGSGVKSVAKKLKFWATGTPSAPAGLSVVGERGPELVNFRGGEQVLNNRNTQKALAGMGGNTNEFNVNFYNIKDTSAYALVSEFKQYNRQMAINGVI